MPIRINDGLLAGARIPYDTHRVNLIYEKASTWELSGLMCWAFRIETIRIFYETRTG